MGVILIRFVVFLFLVQPLKLKYPGLSLKYARIAYNLADSAGFRAQKCKEQELGLLMKDKIFDEHWDLMDI